MKTSQPPSNLIRAVNSSLREPGMLLGTGAALLLFFSVLLFPVFGVILGIFTPLPLIFYYFRRGRIFGLTMIGLAAVVVAFFYLVAGHLFGLFFFVECAILAVVMGEGFSQRLSPGKLVGYPAATLLVLGLLVVTSVGIAQGESPWSYARAVFEGQVRSSLRIYEAMLLPPEQTESGQSAQSAAGPTDGTSA